MFRIIQQKKAQAISEYVIAITAIGLILTAMQLFAQRSITARQHSATSHYLNRFVMDVGMDTIQYEPYYYDHGRDNGAAKHVRVQQKIDEGINNQRLNKRVNNIMKIGGVDIRDTTIAHDIENP